MDLASARSFRRFSASIVAALLRANSANLACLATSSFASLSNFASRLYCQQTIITNTVYLPFLQRQAAVAVIAPRARKRTQILESCFYLFNSRIGARGGVKIFGFPLGFQRVRANRYVLAASLLLITAASLAACGGGSTSGPNSVPITASPTPVPDAPFSVVTSLPVNASGTIAAPISAPDYAGTLSFGGVSSPARTWSFLVINITCRYRWLSQQRSRNLCWERPVRFSLRTPEVRLQFYYHGRGIAWHSGSRLGGLPTQATGSRAMRPSIAMQIRKTVRG